MPRLFGAGPGHVGERQSAVGERGFAVGRTPIRLRLAVASGSWLVIRGLRPCNTVLGPCNGYGVVERSRPYP